MAHNQPSVQLYKYDNAELLLDTQTLRISVKNSNLFSDQVGKIQLDKLHSQVENSFITGLFAIGTGNRLFSTAVSGKFFNSNNTSNIIEEKETKKKHLVLDHISISCSMRIKKKINKLNSSLIKVMFY